MSEDARGTLWLALLAIWIVCLAVQVWRTRRLASRHGEIGRAVPVWFPLWNVRPGEGARGFRREYRVLQIQTWLMFAVIFGLGIAVLVLP